MLFRMMQMGNKENFFFIFFFFSNEVSFLVFMADCNKGLASPDYTSHCTGYSSAVEQERVTTEFLNHVVSGLQKLL